MNKQLLFLSLSLLLVFPTANAFTYYDVIDFFQGVTGAYSTFITGRTSHSQYTMNEDTDEDGVVDSQDNCVYIPNGYLEGTCLRGTAIGQPCTGTSSTCAYCEMNQRDNEFDGAGDVCDNCYDKPNGPLRGTCTAGSRKGQACDLTTPNPCNLKPNEITPLVCEMNQKDTDNNGVGDACDSSYKDSDADGWADQVDNCPTSFNPSQLDSDADGQGDSCDLCPTIAAQQLDADKDGYLDDIHLSCGGQGGDCDDTDNLSYPGAPEDCEDGKDNNCNGLDDQTDPICLKTGPKPRSAYLLPTTPQLGTPPPTGIAPTTQQPSLQQPIVQANVQQEEVDQIIGLIEKINKEMVLVSKYIKAIMPYLDRISPSYEKFLNSQIKLEELQGIARGAIANRALYETGYEQDLNHLKKRAGEIVVGLDKTIKDMQEVI